jgi:hypothetical protein
MPARIALVILLLCLAPGCQSGVAERPAAVTEPEEDRPDTVRMEVDSGDGAEYSMRDGQSYAWGYGWHWDKLEKMVADKDRLILDVDGSTNRRTLQRLMDLYLQKPGFWKEIKMTPADPDRRYADREAALRIGKSEFAQGEPIPLELNFICEVPLGQEWAFCSPVFLHIQDAQGHDVDLFQRPVVEASGGVRSKVFGPAQPQDKIIDLTSFREPYQGAEFVHRFEPGTYTATFHFSIGWPRGNLLGSGTVHLMEPRIFGPKRSNTVTFTVRPAKPASPEEAAALIRKADALVAESKANEAVAAYKRAVLALTDQARIEAVIRQILLVRAVAAFDETPPEGFAPDDDHPQKPLPERIKAFMAKYGQGGMPDWVKDEAFSLSLLHLPADQAPLWYRRFLKFWSQDYDQESPEGKNISRFGERYVDILSYPLYRSLLVEDLRRGKDCPKEALAIYVKQIEPKDTELMRLALAADPHAVLEYYGRVRAPRELLPDFVRFFDDHTITWGNGFGNVQAWLCDAAFRAIEKAAGLDLGFSATKEYDPARVENRAAIRAILEIWLKQSDLEKAGSKPLGEKP